MACFLNGPHPRPGYHHLRIAFMICNFDIIEEMPEEPPYQYQAIDPTDTISIGVWNSLDCDPANNHSIGTWSRPADGLWIERTGENSWLLSVRQDLSMRETFCLEEPYGPGNRTKTVEYTPLSAIGYFNFQLEWIRQPSQ